MERTYEVKSSGCDTLIIKATKLIVDFPVVKFVDSKEELVGLFHLAPNASVTLVDHASATVTPMKQAA